MKTLVVNHEELSVLIYALVASKEAVDPSQHPLIDHLIEVLNK